MLLRVFSLAIDDPEKYKKPMKEFLNYKMKKYQDGTQPEVKTFFSCFEKVVEKIYSQLGANPFRHNKRQLNVCILDSVCSVLIKKCMENRGKVTPMANLRERYDRLVNISDYHKHTTESTSDTNVVLERLRIVQQTLIHL